MAAPLEMSYGNHGARRFMEASGFNAWHC